MPDASPTKWHLAHTSWFFETFVGSRAFADLKPFDPSYRFLFNSYYEAVGPRHARDRRGILSRPSLSDVMAYRRWVDGWLAELTQEQLARPEIAEALELGLHHEQQHQELILTDIKHLFSQNPLLPQYAPATAYERRAPGPIAWREIAEGTREIGHDGRGFSFDNERPRHRRLVESFRVANRLVTCGEILDFIDDGGYARPELWLSDGIRAVRERGWIAPEYWRKTDAGWRVFTLSGERDIDRDEPACHVSYYEADAYARWAGARLPTEEEWEVAASSSAWPAPEGVFLEERAFHPRARAAAMSGNAWVWTGSAYLPYPRFSPLAGAFGEYNGKFMSGQMVLRGGSCLSPRSHLRSTYRNFFPPDARWQMTGILLARNS